MPNFSLSQEGVLLQCNSHLSSSLIPACIHGASGLRPALCVHLTPFWPWSMGCSSCLESLFRPSWLPLRATRWRGRVVWFCFRGRKPSFVPPAGVGEGLGDCCSAFPTWGHTAWKLGTVFEFLTSSVGEAHTIFLERGSGVGKTLAHWKEHRMGCQKILHFNPPSFKGSV